MEAGPKSPPPETSISDEIAGKFPELMAETDALSPEIPIKEELIEEVMQELYKEIAPQTSTTSVSGCTKTSSQGVETFPTPSLVVGNWKSESCGASVSDSASTVMAGIEFVVPGGKMGKSPENGLVVGKVGMDGCDDDDEWFERVLSTWGPVDLDPWF